MNKAAALIAKYPRLLAIVAGGVSATGFAPLNLWPLTLLCLALLMHLVASADTGKRAFITGWLFGVGHFSIGNNWIATAFTYQAAMPMTATQPMSFIWRSLIGTGGLGARISAKMGSMFMT